MMLNDVHNVKMFFLLQIFSGLFRKDMSAYAETFTLSLSISILQGSYRNLTVVSMIFQDKSTLFFKLFHTCLYKQNILKISLNAKQI